MSLTLGLQSALSGILTAQRGLDVTSHNIVNTNTVGYHRKVFTQESVVLAGKGGGVQTGSVQRTVDEWLQKDIRQETSTAGALDTRYEFLKKIQDLFGKPGDNTSFAHKVDDYIAEIDTLAASPADGTQHLRVIQSATDLTRQVNNLSKKVQELRTTADRQINDAVSQINKLLGRIHDLNQSIVRDGTLANNTADLEDKRDLALNELSSYLDIQYFKNNDGMVVVYTNEGDPLVANSPSTLVHSTSYEARAWQSKAGGHFSNITINGNDITDRLASGKLKSLIDLRDSELVNMQAELDQFSASLRDSVNAVHNQGTSFPNMANSLTGSRTFQDPANQTITLGASDDVAFTIYGTDGSSHATTTLRTIVGAGPMTLNAMATALNGWVTGQPGLGGASVTMTDGKLQVRLNSDSYGFAVRDIVSSTDSQKQSTVPSSGYTTTATDTIYFRDGGALNYTFTPGAGRTLAQVAADITADATLAAAGISATLDSSGEYLIVTDSGGNPLYMSGSLQQRLGLDVSEAPQNVTLTYDADGAAASNTTTASGFSSFFGLNDFFVAGKNSIQDSALLSSNYAYSGANTTLRLSDETGLAFASVAITSGMTLQQIADTINNTTGMSGRVTAEVVPEGTGSRLRIRHDLGEELSITESGGTLLSSSEAGITKSNAGLSSDLTVRTDLVLKPSAISRGWLTHDSTTGAFHVSTGDNTVADLLSRAFDENLTMPLAGGQPSRSLTLSSYAGAIIAKTSNDTDNVKINREYQNGLKTSLETKMSDVAGVNRDEELSQMMVFEQSYAAAAKVITTIQKMFDIMNDMIR